MKFTKMHGAGNDYIYVDCFNENVENPEELSRKLSHRHFGVGADGLVLIKPSFVADCSMNIYNSDGTEAQMCGNAIRCVAKYIYDNKKKRDKIKIDTLSGIKVVEIHSESGIAVGGTVNMGKPIFNGRQIPTRYGMSVVKDQIINIDNNDYKITCVGMGNPHCIVFCSDIDKLELNKIGLLFEHHEMFPERINTEFVESIDENHLKMRVWERGSGETLACGTGACAVAVSAIVNGLCQRNKEIKIEALGGTLTVKWHEDNNVYLTGEAVEIFKGEIKM
ncbi:MAG: diaminopimelate epimerase [Clostridia bacterium]|nr:diaminopimelate epimerase [Clostridia bacterium]